MIDPEKLHEICRSGSEVTLYATILALFRHTHAYEEERAQSLDHSPDCPNEQEYARHLRYLEEAVNASARFGTKISPLSPVSTPEFDNWITWWQKYVASLDPVTRQELIQGLHQGADLSTMSPKWCIPSLTTQSQEQ